jgi:creatinine amidohydrolase
VNERFPVSPIIGHACEMEVSTAMYLAPQIVKTDALAQGALTELTTGFRKQMQRYNVVVPHRFDEYTRNGALGDARNASLEYGAALMESALRNFVQFTADLVAATPSEQ